MNAKKSRPKKGEPDRLKLDVGWEEAAKRLLQNPAKSTPPRATKTRKKKAN